MSGGIPQRTTVDQQRSAAHGCSRCRRAQLNVVSRRDGARRPPREPRRRCCHRHAASAAPVVRPTRQVAPASALAQAAQSSEIAVAARTSAARSVGAAHASSDTGRIGASSAYVWNWGVHQRRGKRRQRRDQSLRGASSSESAGSSALLEPALGPRAQSGHGQAALSWGARRGGG